MTTTQLDTTYALAKQVPDMHRGFTIATSYGHIHITAEEAAPFAALTQTVLAGREVEEVAA